MYKVVLVSIGLWWKELSPESFSKIFQLTNEVFYPKTSCLIEDVSSFPIIDLGHHYLADVQAIETRRINLSWNKI